MCVEEEIIEPTFIPTGIVGIDLGIKDLKSLSNEKGFLKERDSSLRTTSKTIKKIINTK